MSPKLRVSAGTSLDNLEVVPVNYDETGYISLSSDHVEGHLAIRLRDFAGEMPKGKQSRTNPESGYFDQHSDLSWSMAIQCRFKEKINADDVLFGNTFEKPIRSHLPYGTAAALKFITYIDPSFEQDIYADKPWALSPLLATMNKVQVSEVNGDLPAWSPAQPEDDILTLLNEVQSDTTAVARNNPNSRRTYLSKKEHRQEITIEPKHFLKLDFCNGFLDFNTFSLKLPGGLHFSLMKYWDGQPVTFVCQNRKGDKKYFFIVFNVIEGEAANPADVAEEHKTSAAAAAAKDKDGHDSDLSDVD